MLNVVFTGLIKIKYMKYELPNEADQCILHFLHFHVINGVEKVLFNLYVAL